MPPKQKKVKIKIKVTKKINAPESTPAPVPPSDVVPTPPADTPLKDISEDIKLFHNSDINRVTLDGWILPSNKQFLKFIRDIFRRATVDQTRDPMKLWNTLSNEYKDITAYKHQNLYQIL